MAKAVWLKQGSEKYYPAPYWPIGSIYISVVNTNPSQWFGGVWVRFAKGKTLVGVDDVVGDPDLTTVLKTGGEYFHTLTINEMPTHTHQLGLKHPGGTDTIVAGLDYTYDGINKIGAYFGAIDAPTAYNNVTGGGQSHNNMPPYITVYMWRRVS